MMTTAQDHASDDEGGLFRRHRSAFVVGAIALVAAGVAVWHFASGDKQPARRVSEFTVVKLAPPPPPWRLPLLEPWPLPQAEPPPPPVCGVPAACVSGPAMWNATVRPSAGSPA